MSLIPSNLIEVKDVKGKGRGVFARRDIQKGSEIERVPLLILNAREVFEGTHTASLSDYVFKWEKDTVALALGYGSLYNHSYNANARFYDAGDTVQVYEAVRAIKKGDEITINYNGPPTSRGQMDFSVI